MPMGFSFIARSENLWIVDSSAEGGSASGGGFRILEDVTLSSLVILPPPTRANSLNVSAHQRVSLPGYPAEAGRCSANRRAEEATLESTRFCPEFPGRMSSPGHRRG